MVNGHIREKKRLDMWLALVFDTGTVRCCFEGARGRAVDGGREGWGNGR